MQEQEFVVQPMDRRAKRALIAVCAAVGAVLVALVVAALVYFLQPVALTDRASSPENGYWLYYHENDIGFEGGLAAGVTRSDDCDTQGDAALTQSVYEVLGQYTCRRSLGTLAGPSDSHLQEGVIVRSTSCLRRRRREAPCSAPSSSTMTARFCSTGLSTG